MAFGGQGSSGLVVIQYTPITAPTISSISINYGPTTGGTSVVITGTNFINVTDLQIDGVNFNTGYTINSSTQITVSMPAFGAGSYSLNVINTMGTSNGLTYTYISVPTISSVSPNSGDMDVATSVTITGTEFINVTYVHIGGVNATSYVVNSSTQITATFPAAASPGAVHTQIGNSSGDSGLSGSDLFTYGQALFTAMFIAFAL